MPAAGAAEQPARPARAVRSWWRSARARSREAVDLVQRARRLGDLLPEAVAQRRARLRVLCGRRALRDDLVFHGHEVADEPHHVLHEAQAQEVADGREPLLVLEQPEKRARHHVDARVAELLAEALHTGLLDAAHLLGPLDVRQCLVNHTVHVAALELQHRWRVAAEENDLADVETEVGKCERLQRGRRGAAQTVDGVCLPQQEQTVAQGVLLQEQLCEDEAVDLNLYALLATQHARVQQLQLCVDARVP
eukprot:96124-Rhodomonas_salina.2